jgi:hypothetical protein
LKSPKIGWLFPANFFQAKLENSQYYFTFLITLSHTLLLYCFIQSRPCLFE